MSGIEKATHGMSGNGEVAVHFMRWIFQAKNQVLRTCGNACLPMYGAVYDVKFSVAGDHEVQVRSGDLIFWHWLRVTTQYCSMS
jgi:hypothetical protein